MVARQRLLVPGELADKWRIWKGGTQINEIHLEVWIDAGRQTVFDAIATMDGLDGWWGPVVEVGNEIGTTVAFNHGLGEPLRMKIVDLVAGERVEWECITEFTDGRNPGSEWLGTRLSFELEDAGPTGFAPIDSHFTVNPITVLHFRHAGWPEGTRWMAFCNYAWGVTLAGLSEYCAKVREPKDPSQAIP